jgi:CRISPR-associated protein Csy2
MTFLVIPHLQIQSANIHNASFLLGGAPILPAYFLGHAIGRKLNFRAGRVALIHHYLHPQGQYFKGTFAPQQRRAASFSFGPSRRRDYSSKNEHALSLQPVATADMGVSLIIECEGLRSLEDVQTVLYAGRFSGGVINRHGRPQLCSSFEQALESIRSGFVVIDRKELLEPQDGKDQGRLLVEALGTTYSSESGRSWMSAACVGYAAITPFEKRAGAREGYQHAFAEPLVGLVQYRSLRTLSEMSEKLLWQPEWIGDEVFRMVQGEL